KSSSYHRLLLPTLIISLLLVSTQLKVVRSHNSEKNYECSCLKRGKEDPHASHSHESEEEIKVEERTILRYKIAALFAILGSSAVEVFLPIAGKNIPALRPERGAFFFLVKGFAAGVILCTAFIHILPEAYDSLNSPCLGEDTVWSEFPFTGLAVMVGALLTLIMDALATRHYYQANKDKLDGHGHGHDHGVAAPNLPHGDHLSKADIILAILVVLQQVILVVGDCTCDRETLINNEDNKNTTLKYKLGAIATILVASALGFSLPMVGKNSPPYITRAIYSS
ncbi:Zinc transporter 3, partial [Bienertia sinuspersici]